MLYPSLNTLIFLSKQVTQFSCIFILESAIHQYAACNTEEIFLHCFALVILEDLEKCLVNIDTLIYTSLIQILVCKGVTVYT